MLRTKLCSSYSRLRAATARQNLGEAFKEHKLLKVECRAYKDGSLNENESRALSEMIRMMLPMILHKQNTKKHQFQLESSCDPLLEK